jgi:hypothetical protein
VSVARLFRAALLLAAPVFAAPLAADPVPDYAGWTLEAALRDLKARGLELVWSSDTVTPELRVPSPAPRGEPAAVLDALLAPHGLEARAESGVRVIVRKARAPDTRRATAPDGSTDDGMFRLDPVYVGTSRYRLLGGSGIQGGEFLGRDEVDRLPHLANDPLRAVAVLPGIAAGDYSARFNVRGGRHDEALLVLDGMPLYEPFHLKNLLSALSIIETRALAGMDVLTGGFPARDGDRMSAVLDMTTVAAHEATSDSAGVSFLNAHLLGAGGGGGSGWLASLRRGYVDIIADFIDTGGTLGPEYYDVYGKTTYAVGESSRLGLHLIYAHDDERFDGDDDEGVMTGGYGNVQAWAALATDWTPWLSTRTTLFAGRFEGERLGSVNEPDRVGAVSDRRHVNFHGARQSLELGTVAGHLFDAGVEARALRAVYDYTANAVITDPFVTQGGPPVVIVRDIDQSPDGHALAAWLGGTFRLTPNLTAALGLRWDRQTWPGLDDDRQTSPRAAFSWQATDTTTLRLAWGRYAQSQGINELQVEDGITAFEPAERAEHRIVGLDQRFGDGYLLRLEAYDKRYTEPRPYYVNGLDPIDLFPEIAADRVRVAPESAAARGVELTLRRSGNPHLDWWASYVRSSAEDRIGGEDFPRPWDQPKAAHAGFDWRPGGRWSFTLVGNYRSGWPTTPVEFDVQPLPGGGLQITPIPGDYNSARLGPVVTFNLRATKETPLADGRLRWYLEVFNLLDRENPCCGQDFNLRQRNDGSFIVSRDLEPWLPLIPSFGVLWEF